MIYENCNAGLRLFALNADQHSHGVLVFGRERERERERAIERESDRERERSRERARARERERERGVLRYKSSERVVPYQKTSSLLFLSGRI